MLFWALALAAPIAAFMAGSGLFQGWEGWKADGSRFLDDEITRSNVVVGATATAAWMTLFIMTRGIRLRRRLILLASFLGMAVMWLWIGVRQLIVL